MQKLTTAQNVKESAECQPSMKQLLSKPRPRLRVLWGTRDGKSQKLRWTWEKQSLLGTKDHSLHSWTHSITTRPAQDKPVSILVWMGGGLPSHYPRWLRRGKGGQFPSRVWPAAMDGSTPMSIWAVQTGHDRLCFWKGGHDELERFRESMGWEDVRGRNGGVNVIKIHCTHVWTSPRINKSIFKSEKAFWER